MKQSESSSSNKNKMSSELTGSIFDWDGLLDRLMGDEDLATEIIGDFLKQIPDYVIAVKNALKNKDLPLVQREAHIIKGASGNIGALTLQEIAEQIEVAGEAKDLDKAESLVARLDKQLEILKNKLTDFRG